MKQRRHHQPDLRLRQGAGRVDARRAGPRQRRCQRDLRRHVRRRRRRRRGARHHRDQGDAGRRLRHRIRGRRDCRQLDHRADHPAVAADGDLWRDGVGLDRPAVRRGVHPRTGDGAVADDHGRLVRPAAELPARRPVLDHQSRPQLRPCLPVADDAGDHRRRHPDRRIHADRGGDRGGVLCPDPGHLRLPHADLASADPGQHGHHRDDGDHPLHRRRGVDLRLDPDLQPSDRAVRLIHPRRHRETRSSSCC